MNFSVLLSVYYKEKSEYFYSSLSSIINQTLLPSEVVIVKDGPLTEELEQVIKCFENKYPCLFKIIELKENRGLGLALNEGLKHCNTNIVARMDSDDINKPHRFEKQLSFFLRNPHLSVLGTNIEEFNQVPGDLHTYRNLPSDSAAIINFAKYRNPLNHPTVLFRRDHVSSVGSYMDMPFFEDYYLWIRMLSAGFAIANIDEPLLYFRTGGDMIGRRHGMSYLKNEYQFIRSIKNNGFINYFQFVKSILIRLPSRLMPLFLLKATYKLLRNV